MIVASDFEIAMKRRLDNSKNNNRKQSNKRFYMLFLSYKIMKILLENPKVSDRQLKLINSKFSRELITTLIKKKFITRSEIKDPVTRFTKPQYNLQIEGIVFIDFIDSYLIDLGFEPYSKKELQQTEVEKEEEEEELII